MHDLAAETDLARIRDHGAAKRLDQGRLPGAVVADHREDLAWIQFEVGMIERSDATIALDELPRREDGFDAHFDTLRIHWSSATAMMISTPRPASETAERKTPTISAPMTVPTIEPRPPNRLVPPMTTAVMLSRLAFSPAVGLIAPTRPMSAQPAIAAMRPASTYTLSRI